jgi:hypothetical protein
MDVYQQKKQLDCLTGTYDPRANGVERRSGRKTGARVLIPLAYLHPGKRKNWRILKFINDRGRHQRF